MKDTSIIKGKSNHQSLKQNKKNTLSSYLETIRKVDKIMEKTEKRKRETTTLTKQSKSNVHLLFNEQSDESDNFVSLEFLTANPLEMTSISNTNEISSLKHESNNSYNKNKSFLNVDPEEAPFESQNSSYKMDSESSLIQIKKEGNTSEKKEKQDKWLYTGIDGFDALLEKGIPTESNIIVAGGPGCGKTIFCLQSIYNLASQGDDCVFLSMEERPDRLKGHMQEFGFNIEEIERTDEQIILRANGNGRICLKRLQPIRLARSIEALLEKASGTLPVDIDLVLDFIPEEFNAKLLTLDSISAIETGFSGTKRQYRMYIEQLFRYFEGLNLTTFMITESSDAPHKFSTSGVEEFLADGIFVFYNFQGVKQRKRGVEIFKLRGAGHSQIIASVEITSKGMIIKSDNPNKDKLIG